VEIEILDDGAAAAERAAKIIAAAAREAVAARGKFVMAVSGGRSPWQMLRVLTKEDVPWQNVQIAQVDERIAPAGDPDRNLTHIGESLLAYVPSQAAQIYAMPVESADLDRAAAEYAATLRKISGEPPVLDLVHLGLGPDGHTASLVPGDRVLGVTNVDVATTGEYQGRRRMTLTYPIIDRARQILWLVTGDDKVAALARLRAADPAIPAGRVCQERATLVAERAATGE
jgi:6-phosphogluconolactonase